MEDTDLQHPVVLSRKDAWSRRPQERLAELRAELADLELRQDDAALLERRRYVVTFRRQHRI